LCYMPLSSRTQLSRETVAHQQAATVPQDLLLYFVSSELLTEQPLVEVTGWGNLAQFGNSPNSPAKSAMSDIREKNFCPRFSPGADHQRLPRSAQLHLRHVI